MACEKSRIHLVNGLPQNVSSQRRLLGAASPSSWTEAKGVDSGEKYIVFSCVLLITAMGLRGLHFGNTEDTSSPDIQELWLSFNKIKCFSVNSKAESPLRATDK